MRKFDNLIRMLKLVQYHSRRVRQFEMWNPDIPVTEQLIDTFINGIIVPIEKLGVLPQKFLSNYDPKVNKKIPLFQNKKYQERVVTILLDKLHSLAPEFDAPLKRYQEMVMCQKINLK